MERSGYECAPYTILEVNQDFEVNWNNYVFIIWLHYTFPWFFYIFIVTIVTMDV